MLTPNLDVNDIKILGGKRLRLGRKLLSCVTLWETKVLDLIAHRATEQLVHGHPTSLPGGIPQCHVDTCKHQCAKPWCAAVTPRREEMLVCASNQSIHLERAMAQAELPRRLDQALCRACRSGTHCFPVPRDSFI